MVVIVLVRAQAESLRALERLQNERTLFEPAARRVVQAALERAGLDGSDSPVVEIGSGGGQLRRWLPDPLLPVMVHTEREPAFVRKFQQAVPHATVQVASAESLPYADGSVAGVLGLCVLDVVDLEAVARELHRVLKPGGSVVQFWDMAPNMRWLCEREIRRRARAVARLFFGSAGAGRAASGAPGGIAAARLLARSGQRAVRPAAEPHRPAAPEPHRPDRRGIAGTPGSLCAAVRRADRPAASAEAARALAWLCEDEREAYACKRLLLNAWLMLQQARGGDKLPLELRRISSAQALSERLTEVFTATGMEVECDVRRARALVPRPPPDRRRGRTPEPLAIRRSMGGNDRLRRGGTARRPRRPGGRRSGLRRISWWWKQASWCWSPATAQAREPGAR